MRTAISSQFQSKLKSHKDQVYINTQIFFSNDRCKKGNITKLIRSLDQGESGPCSEHICESTWVHFLDYNHSSSGITLFCSGWWWHLSLKHSGHKAGILPKCQCKEWHEEQTFTHSFNHRVVSPPGMLLGGNQRVQRKHMWPNSIQTVTWAEDQNRCCEGSIVWASPV